LLRDPRLIERIVADFKRCGVVILANYLVNNDYLTRRPTRASLDSNHLSREEMGPTTEILECLPSLDRADLLDLWKKNFGRPASPGLRRELMLPILAFRIQETIHGGLKPETKTKLHELISPRNSNSVQRFKSGTKLVREWKGKVHEVIVTTEGFEYQGEIYKSLSPIACHITGTHWSGPAFFGTKGKRK
jgi:hypothetical protein